MACRAPRHPPVKYRLRLCRFEETVNGSGVTPLVVAQMVMPIRRWAPFQRGGHYNRVVSDLYLRTAVGHLRNRIHLVTILTRTTFHRIPGMSLSGQH
jgi:hypothetical protein